MDKAVKLLELKAKNLIGKEIQIRCRRTASQTIPGLRLSPYTFNAKLEGVEKRTLTIRKQTGMVYSISLKDEYMTVEDVIQMPDDKCKSQNKKTCAI